MKARTRRRGVSLIEVLATVTIVAIVLPVAMRGISLATALASVTRGRSEATALAQAKLNEIVLEGTSGLLQTEGDFGEQWPAYRWTAAVGDWSEADLSEVHVSVKWATRGHEYEVLLSTLLYTGGDQ